MHKKCILCRQSNTKIVFTEFGVDILKCKNCGHVFSSYQAEQNYGGYFGEKIKSSDQFWWNKAHEKMYNDFCKRFIANKSGRILDVGCGLGYFVKKVSAYPNWQSFGYEISKPAVEYAKSELGLKNVFCGKVEEADFPKKYFDIIALWDVIEHIPDPNHILLYLSSILKDDGFIFMHTPNIKVQLPKAKIKKMIKGMKTGVHYLEAKDHINNYSVKTIKKILSNNGFSKAEFIHIHPIQSVAGSKSAALKLVKNSWFNLARFLSFMTFNKINIDNLFIVARK